MIIFASDPYFWDRIRKCIIKTDSVNKDLVNKLDMINKQFKLDVINKQNLI